MAIAQTRLIALIGIAEAFKAALLERQRGIEAIIAELPAGPSVGDALRALQLIQQLNNDLSFSPAHLETLLTEKAHFKLHAGRNARLAKKARQRRGSGPGAGPSATAPQVIGAGQTTAYYAQTPQAARGEAEPASPAAPSLSALKLTINAHHKAFRMSAPYADPYDDSEPLRPGHARALTATNSP